MDFGVIRSFVAGVCSEDVPEGKSGGYVRVKAAFLKGKSKVVRSGIKFLDRDESDVFADVKDAIVSNLDGGYRYYYVDALWRGDNNEFDSVSLVHVDENDRPLVDSSEAIGMAMSKIVHVIDRQFDKDNTQTELIGKLYAENGTLRADIKELQVANEAVKVIAELEGDSAVTLEALQVVRDIAPSVINAMALHAAAKAKAAAAPDSEKAAATDEETDKAGGIIDECLASVDKLCGQYPGVLTKERKTMMVKVALRHLDTSEVMSIYADIQAKGEKE